MQTDDIIVEMRFFGTPEVIIGGQPVTAALERKHVALLAYLAIEGGRVPRDKVADLLWGEEHNDSDARKNLRQSLYDINRLAPGLIETFGRDAIALSPWASRDVDVTRFEGFIAQDDHQQAAALYRGPFLDGFNIRKGEAFEEWLRQRRFIFERAALASLDVILDQANLRREYDSLAHNARRALAINPFRERPYRELMLALAHEGHFNQALQVYKDCAAMSEREFGAPPSAATMAAHERIVLARASPRPRLPFHQATFISREPELAEATARLLSPECRLLTLLGAGGMGKTRLAIELARRNRRFFLHDICYVALEYQTDHVSGENLLFALAGSLGLAVSTNRLQEAIIDYLRPREMLLILDNFETYVPEAAVVRRVLDEAPDVKVLVTSQKRLDVADEFIYRVVGLAYPDIPDRPYGVLGMDRSPGDGAKIDLEAFNSLALFARATKQLDSTFDISVVIEDVARICRLVDGSPLAIEMIAPWTLTMTCTAIADSLANDLSPLMTYERNFTERHRSLNIVLQRSWEFLSSEEKQVLRRLALFTGEFTQPAAEAIARATEPIMHSLASKSMLDEPGNDRYVMHNLLRTFAIQKLRAAGEYELIAAGHFAHFSAFVESRLPELRGIGQVKALRQLEAVFGDIHAAWRYGVESATEDQLTPLMDGIYEFCTTRSWYTVGIDLSTHAREVLARRALPVALGRLILNEGLMHHHLGNYNQAALCAEEGRRQCERADDNKGMAQALFLLSTLHYDANEYDEAERLMDESANLRRLLNDPEADADWHLFIGHITDLRAVFSPQSKVRSRPPRPFFFEHPPPTDAEKRSAEKAIAHFREALHLYSEMGHLYKAAWCQGAPGQPYFRLHEYHTAAACYQEAAESFRRLNSLSNVVQCLNWAGWVLHWQGEMDEARQHFHEAIRLGLSAMAVKRLLDCLQKYSLFLWKMERNHFIPLAVNAFVAQHPNSDGRIRLLAEEWIENIGKFMREAEGEPAVMKALAYGRQQTLSTLVYALLPN